MPTVCRKDACVNFRSRLGRPPLRTSAKRREIIRACVQSAMVSGQMPSDVELAQQVKLGERTVRDIRLEAGLNRRDVRNWVKEHEARGPSAVQEETLCWTPYAGLWLLVPLLVRSALLPAAALLRWTSDAPACIADWIMPGAGGMTGRRHWVQDAAALPHVLRWPLLLVGVMSAMTHWMVVRARTKVEYG